MSTDDSICESSLPPNKSSGDIGDQLVRIADACRRDDGSDIPLGEQCRTAAAEIERLRREVEEFTDPKLQSMRLENGRFDMSICGPVVERLALAMTGWFRENGCKNYSEMTIHARDEPFESFIVTVQKRGAKSPHELREEAEARALTAESAVAAAQGAMSKFLAAWNSLPEGDYPPNVIGKWLNGDGMKEGLSAIRAAVSKKTGSESDPTQKESSR